MRRILIFIFIFPKLISTYVQSEKLLESMQKLDCGICSIDLQKYYKVSAEAVEVGAKLKDQAFNNGGRKLLHAGRFVVVNNQVWYFCSHVPIDR
jgi:antiviral helicase SKI2